MRPQRVSIAVALSLGLFVAAPTAQAEDWPQFLGPAADGKSRETGLRLDWPEQGPPILWQMEIGETYSAPTTSGGRLFLFDRHGDRARLTCLDADSGKEHWRAEYDTDYVDMYQYGVGPKASPLVDGDRVYTFGVEGRLRAHRVEDGALLWEIDTTEQYGVVQNFFGVGSGPVVEGDLLLVPIGGSPPGSPDIMSGSVKSNGTGVVAFDRRTGEERYRSGDELASYATPTLATIDGRRWAFVFARGGLLGLEPSTGKVVFQFPWRSGKLESVNAATPLVVGDTVLITESYGMGSVLLRIKPKGPEVVWQDPPKRGQSLASHWATPIHHDGVVFGVSGPGSGDAEVRALEHGTGKVLWSMPELGRSTLLWVDGHLIVLTERGRLLVLPAGRKKPEPIADVTLTRGRSGAGAGETAGGPLLRFPAWSPPILSHGRLYVIGKDRLVCLDLRPSAEPEKPGSTPATGGK